MFSHERYMSSLQHPSPYYATLPPNTNVFQARVEMDDYSYRPDLPQGSSTEDSIENRNELLPSSKMKELTSCFTPCGPSISSPSVACFLSAGLEQRLFENEATHVAYNGLQEDEGRRDREHKKRSKNWTRMETLKLIKERSGIDVQFGRSGRKAELWDAIAESLQREGFVRDAQQCKDKWEKLSAGYKEVREGVRDKADFPYHDELHMLCFERSKREERAKEVGFDLVKEKQEVGCVSDLELEQGGEFASTFTAHADTRLKESREKQMKDYEHISAIDLSAVQELMETLLAKQQKFLVDLLNAVERREQEKEKIRQDREDKWRAEERAQRRVLNNTMVLLAQKLLEGHSTPGGSAFWKASEYAFDAEGGLKKRPKFCKQ